MRKLIIIVAILLAGTGFLVFSRQTNKQPETADTRVVEDGNGRRVTIPKQPQRIIALNSSNIDLIYGAGGSVIARPNRVSVRESVMEQIKDLPLVGESGAPSVETIVSLKPDLVLGLNMPFHQKLAEPLEQVGIPVLLQSLGGYGDTVERLRFYGELSGKPETAKTAIDNIEKKLAEALEKKKGRSPRTLLLFGTPDSYSMALPESFAGSLLELLGGDNVAAGQQSVSEKLPYMSFNMEYVVKSDPDLILLIVHGAGDNGSVIRGAMDRNTAWRELRAVKNGNVHVLPYELFGINPGVRTGDSIEFLGNLLYGDGEGAL